MKRFLLLIVFAYGASVNAQLLTMDSLRITNLSQQLKSASGKAEVDILNDLAWEYCWVSKDKSLAKEYAIKAKAKAAQIDYKKGLGLSLITLSWTMMEQNGLCDSMINAATIIGETEKDYALLGRTYHRKWDMKKAFEYFKRAGDEQGEAEAATWLCNEYSQKGQYDEAGFTYCQRALELANVKKTYTLSHSEFMSQLAFEVLSNLSGKVGDYQTAFAYLGQAAKHAARIGSNVDKQLAALYQQIGKNDSALIYFERAYKANQNVRGLSRQVGTVNLLAHNYNRAIELLSGSLEYVIKNEAKLQFPPNYKGSLYLELAEAYKGSNNQKASKQYYLSALEEQQLQYYRMLNKADPFLTPYQKANFLMEMSLGLSKSYQSLNRIDSAYKFLQKYVEHKEQVQNQNVLWRLNMNLSNYKKAAEDQKRTSQLQLLNKDNQLKQSQLKQEATLRNGLITGLILLLLTAIFTFRTLHLKRNNERLRRLQLESELTLTELESKQKQTELQQKATNLEMQALRAQMNPHFIFNCLSSINRFVLKNETEAASDYLTRFSRLIRMVLINSQKTMITLEDELEMLRLYLDMERLRFKHSFDYHIIFSNTVDAGNIFIPPLLLQPFCENAIWHGLMHKKGQGRLDIQIRMEDQAVHCVITDNGIGRKKAEGLKSKSVEKSKSLGLKITTDRLALLNEDRNIQSFYQIHDLVAEDGSAAGTKVALQIRYKEEMTEVSQ
jgi:lipopolysaccharide biosynthesis regulator YciM